MDTEWNIQLIFIFWMYFCSILREGSPSQPSIISQSLRCTSQSWWTLRRYKNVIWCNLKVHLIYMAYTENVGQIYSVGHWILKTTKLILFLVDQRRLHIMNKRLTITKERNQTGKPNSQGLVFSPGFIIN